MARFTERQWKAVRGTLPSGVDETLFRRELESIALDTSSPRKQEQLYLDSARLCADFIRRLPSMEEIKDKDQLREQLKRQQQSDRNRAKIYGHIAAQKQPRHFLKQCEILQLWEGACGRPRITTPQKKRDDPHTPPPTGDVISYFQAVAAPLGLRTPGAYQIKDIVRRYRRTFRPGSTLIASATQLSVVATSVKQGSTHIASSTELGADATSVKQGSANIAGSTVKAKRT
jgi:hypothetical protein